MGFDQYHEPADELSQETRTFARMITSLIEEAEAIGWYEQRMSLEKDKEEINKALGVNVDWYTKEGSHTILVQKPFRGELLSDSREAVQEWLADNTERFIAVLRPRIDQFLREQGIVG